MPDIHWHIGDGADQETIAKATSARRSQRSWIAILIVVILGAGLGALYRSIPEPAPRPTSPAQPTPRPTPTYPAVPAKLYASIDREAQALADGDVETVIALHTPQDTQMTEWQRNNLKAWGRPTDDRPLYTIIDFNLRSQTKAWADIRQFRNGRSFRETRFYVWSEDRWLRSEPDPFFWSEQSETLDAPHFHVIYFIEDRDLVQPVINQLERARDKLCVDLGCDGAPLTYSLRLNSSVTSGWPISDDGREIRFASPRLMGVYEDAVPLGNEGLNLIWTLAWTTVLQRTYGQPSVVDDRANNPLLWAISRWAAMRAADRPDIEWLSEVKVDLKKRPLPLETLWDNVSQSNYQAIYGLAYATVHFIEQEYGALSIPKLLQVFGTAQSFADVVENGLGVPFAKFEQKWQAWIKQNLEASR
jgi:hypothetical protein